ncbi:hypothetical protein Bhyg_03513, partial [Pseudolycoriella hygida]
RQSFKPKIVISGADKNYGTSACARPDMDMDHNTFEFEKKKLLDQLAVNQTSRVKIEEEIRGQHANGDWKRYRDMLIASNFDSVCCAKSPQSYPGIVELEEVENIKFTTCGLFIDSEFSFLGASPDGVCGENIVEVKCPYSIFENDIEKAILDGKLTITIWSKERKSRKSNDQFVPKITGINKRHKWLLSVNGVTNIVSITKPTFLNKKSKYISEIVAKLSQFNRIPQLECVFLDKIII